MTTQKSFLESVNDMNLLKSKIIHDHDENLSPEKYRNLRETDVEVMK